MRRLGLPLNGGALRMKEQEYQASLNGLNIFFGAILGVSVGGIETLEPLPFMMLLFMVAAVVISILYIAASPHRIAYAAALMTVLGLVLLMRDPTDLLFGSIPVPDKLLPTLIVWTAAVIVVEFSPRERTVAVPPPDVPT